MMRTLHMWTILAALIITSTGCDNATDPPINPIFRGCANEEPGGHFYWEKVWILIDEDGSPEAHCIRTTYCNPDPAVEQCGDADPYDNVSSCFGATEIEGGLALSTSGASGVCLIPCDPADPQGCYFGTCTYVDSIEAPGFVCLP